MAGTQWIVKLIPIGNPEDKLFALNTVGGSGVEDFAGYHLDKFTASTDAVGNATVTLRHTPTSLDTCFVLMTEDERILSSTNLVGTSLTVLKRKILYKKPVTPIGLVTAAPSGVSIESASGAVTGDTAPSVSISVSTTGATGAGAGADDAISDASASGTVAAHHHSIDSIYDHRHPLTFADEHLEPADLESTTFLVLYQ